VPSTRHDPTETTWDVVIVGAGPAGAATAITLARFGQRVLLVEERVSTRVKLGESLPPTSIGLVKHFLGDPEGPEQNLPGLFRTAGNVSLWATEEADIADFFFTPSGFGLCVERLAFDEALRSKAVAAGATLLKGVRFQSCARIADGSLNWQLRLTSETRTQQYRARYIVDCSGRRAVVARTLGVQTVRHDDRLFAYAQWFSRVGEDDDRYTRIEAAPHGWWYSNRLPSTEGNKPNDWWSCTPTRTCPRRELMRVGKASTGCWATRRISRHCSKLGAITRARQFEAHRPTASDYGISAVTLGWRWEMQRKHMIRCRRKASTKRSGRPATPDT
jgi:2-polyprenyl-6-methoxyphenol hydroxylase-like FAD-dependent oxidoreductase